MNARRLSSILKRILAASVTAAGCGGIDVDDFDPVPCGPQGTDWLSGLTLADPADYVELRQFVDDPPTPTGETKLIQASGTKCGAANDAAACEAALAAARPAAGFLLVCVQYCPHFYLVVNRGDDVSVLATSQEVLGALGKVDSPSEAILVVELAGYTVTCGDSERGGVKPVDGGYEVLGTRYTNDCDPIETTLYRLGVDASGSVGEIESEVIESEDGVCIGRRPALLRPRRERAATPLAAYWGGVTHLEAASIHAFATLRRELAHYGAPARLLRAATRSMRDEARHAVLTRRLAARYGAPIRPARVTRQPVRSLEEIAVENAVEGCVRETFGVLVGQWQARFAGDAEVRRVMRSVSRDELRHAALAWEVDAWVRGALDHAARRRIDDAHRAACDALGRPNVEPHADLVRWAGVPDARTEAELARRFRGAVTVGRLA